MELGLSFASVDAPLMSGEALADLVLNEANSASRFRVSQATLTIIRPQVISSADARKMADSIRVNIGKLILRKFASPRNTDEGVNPRRVADGSTNASRQTTNGPGSWNDYRDHLETEPLRRATIEDTCSSRLNKCEF